MSSSIKLLVAKYYKELSLNLTSDGVDNLFDEDLISVWEYEFLIDTVDSKTKTDKQELLYSNLLKKISRKKACKEIKKKKWGRKKDTRYCMNF